MKIADALLILQSLADGNDPFTGQQLASDSLYHNPQIIRAFYTIIQKLRDTVDQSENDDSPRNAWRPWTRKEDNQLVQEFDDGMNIAAIAGKHKRTPGAILSRLVRIGKIESRRSYLSGQRKPNSVVKPATQEQKLLAPHAPKPGNRLEQRKILEASQQPGVRAALQRQDEIHASMTGRGWSAAEDAILTQGFDSGVTLQQLAERLHRTAGAVEVRLFKLGKLVAGKTLAQNSNLPG